ncbi:MAG: hypothetical protein K6B75_08545 [Lachnospiraceae bacterium]|nr:hypothetical protein [Lachnospiraceae bacterium]
MGKFLRKLELKYGKYAIKNLPLYILVVYALGYVIELFSGQTTIMSYLVLNPYLIIHKGQIWRLVTWLLVPPSGFDIWTLIMLYFYFSISKTLENVWGSFKFNLYIFSGIIFTIIGAFIMYGISKITFADYIDVYTAEKVYTSLATVDGVALPSLWFFAINTYYISMSILLAFAATFPETPILFMFFIPLKMKWVGIGYGVYLVYLFIVSAIPVKIIIVMSLLNFLFFFLATRDYIRVSPREFKRKSEFKRKMREAERNAGYRNPYTNTNSGSSYNSGSGETYSGSQTTRKNNVITRHKCAICGRTELDDPNLEFRFCSKCDGNYEYCMDHLYTHEHVKRIVPGKTEYYEDK